MLSLSTATFMVCVALSSSIQPRNSSLDKLPTLEFEARLSSCTCIRQGQTVEQSKAKESSWIFNMKDHLDHLNLYMDILKREYEELSNITTELKFVDKKEYLGKPMALFALLKRSAQDWPKVALLIQTLTGSNSVSYNNTSVRLYNGYKTLLPSIEDLGTGHRGLFRLMSVYDLGLNSLPAQNVMSHANLFTARDYTGLAQHFCTDIYSEECKELMKNVEDKKHNSAFMDISEEEFQVLSALSNCLNGNHTSVNIILQDLLQRKTTLSGMSSIQSSFDEIFSYGCEKIYEDAKNMLREFSKVFRQPNLKDDDQRFIAWDKVNVFMPDGLELCRYPAVYNVTARLLKCRYVHYNKPQLMIGPFKMEEFHIDPPILMFHDVISDKEISEMVNYGWDIMYKATILTNDGLSVVDVNVRSNEQGWIEDEELPVARVLSRRTALMTGWSLPISEPNQIACYGPGGEFTPHVDALYEDALAINPDYADYSVAMFYINDVVAGGHTIFPYFNVSLAPRKGSAAIWFNRLPDGSPDMKSLHGGCPVLEGYKWVINKWFHITSQDFPRCSKKKENIDTSFRYFYL